MEMTPEYMAETVKHLATCGFEVESGTEVYGERTCDRYRVQGKGVDIVLESFRDDEGPRFFMECKYHRMRWTSFPLDSWKHFPNHVEFKFYSLAETGMGLSFILDIGED